MRKKNTKHNSGFTLSETLIVLVVLVLLAGALATGLKAAGTSFNQISGKNDAQILCETLSQAILDEIHYSSDPKSDGSFTSTNYGSGVSFSADDDGHILLGNKQLLGSGTYGNMKAAVSVAFDGELFNTTLTIKSPDGRVLSTSSFSARQIGIAPSTGSTVELIDYSNPVSVGKAIAKAVNEIIAQIKIEDPKATYSKFMNTITLDGLNGGSVFFSGNVRISMKTLLLERCDIDTSLAQIVPRNMTFVYDATLGRYNSFKITTADGRTTSVTEYDLNGQPIG